jgi:hypothetical protein
MIFEETTMKATTLRGKTIDMGALLAKHANVPALGNAGMNARGDIIGKNGEVITRREETTNDYYNQNPKAVRQVSLKDIGADVLPTPAEVMANIPAAPRKSTRKISESDD